MIPKALCEHAYTTLNYTIGFSSKLLKGANRETEARDGAIHEQRECEVRHSYYCAVLYTVLRKITASPMPKICPNGAVVTFES